MAIRGDQGSDSWLKRVVERLRQRAASSRVGMRRATGPVVGAVVAATMLVSGLAVPAMADETSSTTDITQPSVEATADHVSSGEDASALSSTEESTPPPRNNR